MPWSEIAFICISVAFVLVVFAWTVSVIKKKKKNRDRKVDEYEIIDGVRYTKHEEVLDESGQAKVSLKKGDHMLECGKEYIVGKEGDLLPGKYTILTANENITSANIRIGGIVRDYKHFSSIVLTKGDKISPVSSNIILR